MTDIPESYRQYGPEAAEILWNQHQAISRLERDNDRLRAEVEALKVIISQWYSVYTDDMPPDGDLLADTDAALRGEGEK